jgi:glycosyltransferase involved in cell wall biosynthesis
MLDVLNYNISNKKRILILSTVSRQFYLFEKLNIKILSQLGWEIHCAANFLDQSIELDDLPIIRHQIDFNRSPFSFNNLKAIYQVYSVLRDFKINLIHCHSPVGGAVSRLVGIFFLNIPIIYTAHGFHFYKGAPWLNWLLYFPVEFLLSIRTSVLITINKEDFNRALKFCSKNTCYVPGIGIDLQKYSICFSNHENLLFRKKLGIPIDSTIFISIGELIPRKNFETAIKAFSSVKDKNSHFLICGKGEQSTLLLELSIELGLFDRIHFLGFRKDIAYILRNCDVFLFPSFQEGLPVSLMEAMATGLPVICSQIRGNVDLIDDNGGILINPHEIVLFTEAMNYLNENKEIRRNMGANNKIRILSFSELAVENFMRTIYTSKEINSN